MDLLLRRYGMGNTWSDNQGNPFVEMIDTQGNSYFVSTTGEILCCYNQSEAIEGLFMYLEGIEISPHSTPQPVATTLPIATIEAIIEIVLDPQEHLESGFAHLEEADYGQALDSFTNVIRTQEDSSQAYLGAGQAHYYLGNYVEAVLALEKALLIDPALDEAHYFRSLSSLHLSSSIMAFDDYLLGLLSEARSLDGNSTSSELDGLLHPGAIEGLSEDDYREVLLHLNIVIGEVPGDPNLYTARSITHALLNDYELALDDLDFAVRLDPSLAISYLKRSFVYYALDMADNALDDYVTATRLDPSLTSVQFERMLVNWFTNDVLNSEPGDEGALLRRANAYRELEFNNLALADYANAIDMNPVSEWAYLGLARLFFDSGQVQSAISDLDRSIEFNPMIPVTHSLRAEAFIVLSRQTTNEMLRLEFEQQAIVDYAQAIQLDPTNVDLYLARGDARRDAGRFELALADYSRALNFDPESSRAYFQRGNLYYGMAQQRVRVSNLERSLEDHTVAIDLDPENAEYLMARARVYVGLGQSTNAIEDLFGALEVSLDTSDVLLTIGETYHNLGEFSKAVQYFTQAIDFEPQADALFHRRSMSYRALKDPESALDDLSRASELSPKKPLYFIEQANLLIGIGRHSEAIAYLTSTIELADEDAQLYTLRANTYENLGEYDMASDDYEHAIRLDPRNHDLIYRRTLALLALDDFETALDTSRSGLQLSSEDARFLVTSGNANLGLGFNEAALVAYDKALAKPSLDLIELTSSVTDYAEYDSVGVVRMLEDARARKSEIHLGRAKALMALDQYQAALQAFDQSIDLIPDNPDLYWHRATARVAASCDELVAFTLSQVDLPVVQGNVTGITVEFSSPNEIRSGPGESYPLVASEPIGFRADLTGQSLSGDWYEIRYGPGNNGLWVKSSGVSLTDDIDRVMVVNYSVPLQAEALETTLSDLTCTLDPDQHQNLLAAVTDYTSAINLSSIAQYHIDRGYVHGVLGQQPEALEDIAVSIQDGSSEFSRVQLERARDILEEHLASGAATSSNLGVYGAILSRMGEHENALDAISTALDLDPENPDLHQARGELYSITGDIESAISNYAVALDLVPSDMVLRKLRADKLVKFAKGQGLDSESELDIMGMFQIAINDYSDLIQSSPQNPELYVHRADANEYIGNHDLAVEDYSTALEIDDTVIDWYGKRAISLAAVGEPNLAFADYKQAITIDPSESLLYYERAKLHNAQGNSMLALEDINRAIALNKSESLFLETRASFYNSANDFQSAMQDLTKAIELSSDNVDLYHKRAEAWHYLGEFRQAIADYNIVLNFVLDNSDYYLGRARAYVSLADFSLALNDIAQAISIEPDMHEHYAERASVLMSLYAIGPVIEDDQDDTQSNEESEDHLDLDSSPVEENIFPMVQGRSVGVTLEFISASEIRSGPGEEYPLVASELAGFTTDLTGKSVSGDWYEIRYGPAGYGLWVHNSRVLVTGDIERVIVVSDISSFKENISENTTSDSTETDTGLVESEFYSTEQLSPGFLLEEALADYSTAIEKLEAITTYGSHPDDMVFSDMLIDKDAEYHVGRAAVWQSLAELRLAIVDAVGQPRFSVDELWHARNDYDHAIALMGDNAQYLYGRSEINLQLGLKESALLDYLSAIEMDPLVADLLHESLLAGAEVAAVIRIGE